MILSRTGGVFECASILGDRIILADALRRLGGTVPERMESGKDIRGWLDPAGSDVLGMEPISDGLRGAAGEPLDGFIGVGTMPNSACSGKVCGQPGVRAGGRKDERLVDGGQGRFRQLNSGQRGGRLGRGESLWRLRGPDVRRFTGCFTGTSFLGASHALPFSGRKMFLLGDEVVSACGAGMGRSFKLDPFIAASRLKPHVTHEKSDATSRGEMTAWRVPCLPRLKISILTVISTRRLSELV